MNDTTSEEVLRHRALASMRDTTIRTTYLTVLQVAERWGVSRSVVESIPVEVLPYVDLTPRSARAQRRYNPAVVLAAEEIWLPEWRNALAVGDGERYLRSLRELHKARHAQILARVTQVAG